ncbi:hypothetical protein MTO96_008143 [Rhipicephalus appendiculatus]
MLLACRLYNTCKDTAEEKLPEQLFECLLVGLRNENARTYTKLKIPIAFMKASEDGLWCIWALRDSSIDMQVIDDCVAFTRKAILSFGWT